MKDKVLQAYARLAKDYETNIDDTSDANAHYERPAMMKLIPDDLNGWSVLDAGCAAGWYSEQFMNRGATVTAVDFTPEMVDACKRRLGEKATVFVHDLTNPLPLPDSTMNLVVSSLTLHYLDDWSFTFKEFHRVLKPGGKFMFSVHHPFMDFTSFDRPDYFAHELLVDTWKKKEAGEVEVTFFRRSLQEVVNATTTQFTLEQLVEPRPDVKTRDKWVSKAWYDRLMKEPHFLIVCARK